MNKIKLLLASALLLLLASCNELPNTWGSQSDFNPFTPEEVTYSTKSTYLYANNSSWIDSGMVYDPTYVSTIIVYEDTPSITGGGPSGDPQQYKGTLSGNVVLCPQGNSLQPGVVQPLFGGITQRFTNNQCQYMNGSPMMMDGINGNSGQVEYIISNNSPSTSQSGTAIDPMSMVTYANMSVPGAQIQNSQQGKLWLRIIDEDGNYQENMGRYKVTVKQPSSATSPNSFMSKLTEGVINPITRQIDMISQTMFENGAQSGVFKNIVRVLLILYVMFYGVAFLIGTQEITHRDFLIRLVKAAVVMTLISDTGIDFFNDYLFNFLKNGQRELLNIVSNPQLAQDETGRLNIDSLFGFSNFVLTTIFSTHFFSILAAFFLWFPIGWFCLGMLLYTIVVYVFAILEVIVMYVIAYTALGLFIALGPLFIPLMLFERTKGLFDGWISAMVSYTMQPVVMFATILLITAFINETIYNLLTMQIQPTPIFQMYIDFGIAKLTLFTIYWLNPVDPVLQVLTDILIFYLFIELLKKVTALSTDLSQFIFGRTAGTGAAQEIMSNIKSGINTAIGAPILAAKSFKGGDRGKTSRRGVGGDKNSESYTAGGQTRRDSGISVSKSSS